MEYKQFTKCVDPGSYISIVAILGAGAAVAAGIIVTTLFFGGGLVPGLAAAALTFLIAYCLWWLYDRLICLGGERCAIGLLFSVEPPENKSGIDRFDTDYSINLLLAPHGVGSSFDEVANDGLQGYLIAKQDAVKDKDFSNRGYLRDNSPPYLTKSPKPDEVFRGTAVLHCEFEGGGVYDLLAMAQSALPFAAAAAVVCSIPIIGWIACAVLSAITAALVIIGIIDALNDKGSPTVEGIRGSLTPLDGTDGKEADILLVKGTWVYDSAHDGWNEIHPIKHCQYIGKWNSSSGWAAVGGAEDVNKWVKEYCGAVDDATSPQTLANQSQPENQWEIHPLVDGCKPDEVPTPIK
jgi:hypothetical protein